MSFDSRWQIRMTRDRLTALTLRMDVEQYSSATRMFWNTLASDMALGSSSWSALTTSFSPMMLAESLSLELMGCCLAAGTVSASTKLSHFSTDSLDSSTLAARPFDCMALITYLASPRQAGESVSDARWKPMMAAWTIRACIRSCSTALSLALSLSLSLSLSLPLLPSPPNGYFSESANSTSATSLASRGWSPPEPSASSPSHAACLRNTASRARSNMAAALGAPARYTMIPRTTALAAAGETDAARSRKSCGKDASGSAAARFPLALEAGGARFGGCVSTISGKKCAIARLRAGTCMASFGSTSVSPRKRS